MEQKSAKGRIWRLVLQRMRAPGKISASQELKGRPQVTRQTPLGGRAICIPRSRCKCPRPASQHEGSRGDTTSRTAHGIQLSEVTRTQFPRNFQICRSSRSASLQEASLLRARCFMCLVSLFWKSCTVVQSTIYCGNRLYIST